MSQPIRIGVLGAARITPIALLGPAQGLEGVEVTAMAARDKTRATKFAAKHGIATVHDSYDALLNDPNIDAIYNPLPNSHHMEWTIKALEAGKHVLCEKPMAANADQAQAMKDAADRTGMILAEAFHWRYHPLCARVQEIMTSGEIGEVQHIHARFCIPLPEPKNIRWRLDLAGGATMDTGCYTVNMLRVMAGAEPHIISAKAKQIRPGVDRSMQAQFRFDDGRTGSICTSMLGWPLVALYIQVRGSEGDMHVTNPLGPHLYNKITVNTDAATRSEKVSGKRATYSYQLEAFRNWLRDGVPMPSDAADGVRNMQVIDDIYRAAGMMPRTSAQD